MATVLKTVIGASLSWVKIPAPPPTRAATEPKGVFQVLPIRPPLAHSRLSYKEAAVLHDLAPVHCDGRVRGEGVDVRRARPVGLRLEPVRVAECDVHAGELFVLEKVPDDAF